MSDEDKKVYVCAFAVDWDRNLFPDNKLGKCSECGEMIVYRPDGPADDSGIDKICPKCCLSKIHEAQTKGESIKTEVWNPTDVINALRRMTHKDELD